jgi:hypothetical protein
MCRPETPYGLPQTDYLQWKKSGKYKIHASQSSISKPETLSNSWVLFFSSIKNSFAKIIVNRFRIKKNIPSAIFWEKHNHITYAFDRNFFAVKLAVFGKPNGLAASVNK